jgi:type IX secretion system PorP/SprF family membrane protein
MRYIVIIILLFISIEGKSQLSPLYSQYLMNGLLLNPAYAGSRDVLSVSAMYRNQWVGFEGAPVTTALSAHWPFRNKALAAGILVMNEKIGISNTTGCYGNYAYRFRTADGFFSLGLKAGVEMWKESQTSTRETDDDAFGNHGGGYFLPNFGFGVYFYNQAFFVGASVPTMLSYREKSKGNGFEAYHTMKNYNYLLSGGLLIKIEDNFSIKPSTLLRYNPTSPFQYDLNCNFLLLKDGILWMGASYRNKEAVVGLIEFQINTQIRLGYSYDYSLGSLSQYNNGTHEITLRYEFRYIVNAINPKFF